MKLKALLIKCCLLLSAFADMGLLEEKIHFPVNDLDEASDTRLLTTVNGSLGDCWSERKDGKFVEEGHYDNSSHECYDLDTAVKMCEFAVDCYAVATQTNVCDGEYRVTHGGPTLTAFSGWQTYKIGAYELDRACLPVNATQQYSYASTSDKTCATDHSPLTDSDTCAAGLIIDGHFYKGSELGSCTNSVPGICKKCWTEEILGRFVEEGHYDDASSQECSEPLSKAMENCEAAADCYAVTRQSNMCDGSYRVTHGGPTWKELNVWKQYNMTAWSLDRACLQQAKPDDSALSTLVSGSRILPFQSCGIACAIAALTLGNL